MTIQDEIDHARRMSILFDPPGEKWTPEDDEEFEPKRRVKKITTIEYENEEDY